MVSCEGSGKGFQSSTRTTPGHIIKCNNCCGLGEHSEFCGSCTNGVIVSVQTLNVHLTPDVRRGYQFKFSKKGTWIPGTIAGDLIVEVKLLPHPLFKIQGEPFNVSQKHNIKRISMWIYVSYYSS